MLCNKQTPQKLPQLLLLLLYKPHKHLQYPHKYIFISYNFFQKLISFTFQSPVISTPTIPLQRKSIKSGQGLPGRPRGRPPNINKHLTGAKLAKGKEHGFLPANPYSWQNLLYQQAMSGTVDPNAALNFMMKKYQEELLRQYTLSGASSSLLTNPFLKNPLMSSSGLTSTSFTPPISKSSIPTVTKPATSMSMKSASLNSKVGMPPPKSMPSVSSLPKQVSSQSVLKLSQPTVPKSTPLPSTIKPTTLPSMGKPDKRDFHEQKLRYSKESNKSYYAESSKEYGNNISIFKDRPGISITPINQSPLSLNKPPLPTSPGKTLQQKLAERQKQNPAMQQQKPGVIKTPMKHDNEMMNQLQNYPKNIPYSKQNIPAPAHSSSYPKPSTSLYQPIPKQIPSSLTITRTQSSPVNIMQGIQTGDSGISISPLMTPPYKDMNMMSFRKPSVPKLKTGGRKLGSEITVTPNYSKPTYIDEPKINFPPNIPMSLSVVKKDSNRAEPKPKSDSVEIITIE